MPNIVSDGDHGESTGRRVLERIKLPHISAPKKLTPGKKILHKKTKKFKSKEQLL
jgi:hypothetical protein